MPSAAPIPTDLPCSQCHYNLRTLSPASRCPECGTPVAHSLHPIPPRFRPKRLAAAAALLAALPALAAGLDHLTQSIFPHNSTGTMPGDLTLTALYSLLVYGTLLLALRLLFTALPHPKSRRSPPFSTAWVRTALALAIIAIPPLLNFSWELFNWWPSRPIHGTFPGEHLYRMLSTLLLHTQFLAQAALYLALLFPLRQIASRAGRAWFKHFSALCLPLCAAACLILLLTRLTNDAMIFYYHNNPYEFFFTAPPSLIQWFNRINALDRSTPFPLYLLHTLYWTLTALTAQKLSPQPRPPSPSLSLSSS